MKHKSAALAAVCSLTLLGPAAQSKTPGIIDCHAKLVQENKIDNIIEFKKNRWLFVVGKGDEKITGRGSPVVDVRNGYISYSYDEEPCAIDTELALFIGDNGNYIAVSQYHSCIEGTGYSFTMYRCPAGLSVEDATGRVISISADEFFDEKTAASGSGIRAKLEELKSFMVIRYTLPRIGTTVTAVLTSLPEGQVGVDQLKIAEADAFLRKYKKYSKIEFRWSTQKSKFLLHKKITAGPVLTAP